MWEAVLRIEEGIIGGWGWRGEKMKRYTDEEGLGDRELCKKQFMGRPLSTERIGHTGHWKSFQISQA